METITLRTVLAMVGYGVLGWWIFGRTITLFIKNYNEINDSYLGKSVITSIGVGAICDYVLTTTTKMDKLEIMLLSIASACIVNIIFVPLNLRVAKIKEEIAIKKKEIAAIKKEIDKLSPRKKSMDELKEEYDDACRRRDKKEINRIRKEIMELKKEEIDQENIKQIKSLSKEEKEERDKYVDEFIRKMCLLLGKDANDEQERQKIYKDYNLQTYTTKDLIEAIEWQKKQQVLLKKLRKKNEKSSNRQDGIMQAGKDGEERVKRFLQQLSFPNTVINDRYVDNINSVKDAQVDHFVVSEKGIVMIETKNYSGEIDMTDRNQWIQTKPNGERKACTNAYYQSVSHMQIMENLMRKNGFDDVKLYAIVVFANEGTIYHGLENYHGYVMKFDAMNYFLTGLPLCPAMKDKQRRDEVVRWIRSFKKANSYDK